VNIGGKTKEWRAVMTEQIPDQCIAWTSTTDTRNAEVGTFHRLGEHYTRIMLQIDYEPVSHSWVRRPKALCLIQAATGEDVRRIAGLSLS